MTDSTAPSLNSCRAIRQRLAPRAARIASSRRRPVARINNRFATLTHAISSTTSTPPCSRYRDSRTSRTSSSRNPVASPVKPLFRMYAARAGTRSMRRLTIACIWASSCSMVAPSRRRPIIMLNSLPRSSSDRCARRKGKRHEQSRIPPCRPRHLEVGRQNADDDVLSGIEMDRPADDGAIRAET